VFNSSFLETLNTREVQLSRFLLLADVRSILGFMKGGGMRTLVDRSDDAAYMIRHNHFCVGFAGQQVQYIYPQAADICIALSSRQKNHKTRVILCVDSRPRVICIPRGFLLLEGFTPSPPNFSVQSSGTSSVTCVKFILSSFDPLIQSQRRSLTG